MSINVLCGLGKHTKYDDIQSFFYVLVFICLEYAGPGLPRKWNIFEHSKLRAWFEGESLDSIGLAKFAVVGSRARFGTEVLDRLPSYFQDFRTLFDDLRDCIFHKHEEPEASGGGKATHERIIQILRARLGEPFDETFKEAEVRLSDEEWVERRGGSTFLVDTDIDGVPDKARAGSGDDGLQHDDVQGRASASAELSPSGPQDGDDEHKSLQDDDDKHKSLQDDDDEDSTDSLQGNDNKHSSSLRLAKRRRSGSFVVVSQSHSTGSPASDRGNGLQEDDTEDHDEDDDEELHSIRFSTDSGNSLQSDDNEHSPSLRLAKRRRSRSFVVVPQSHSTGSPASDGGNGLQEDDDTEHSHLLRPTKRHCSHEQASASTGLSRIVVPQPHLPGASVLQMHSTSPNASHHPSSAN